MYTGTSTAAEHTEAPVNDRHDDDDAQNRNGGGESIAIGALVRLRNRRRVGGEVGHRVTGSVPAKVGKRQAQHLIHERSTQDVGGLFAGAGEEVVGGNGSNRPRDCQRAKGNEQRWKQTQVAADRDVVDQGLDEQRRRQLRANRHERGQHGAHLRPPMRAQVGGHAANRRTNVEGRLTHVPYELRSLTRCRAGRTAGLRGDPASVKCLAGM